RFDTASEKVYQLSEEYAVTTIGLAANLFFNYCPLARMMYLLPWNREEPFSFKLVLRVFLSPPVSGKFKPYSSVA
ncbi:hypothetical protein RIF25_16895, partial [Thermosynechococcaceae cyanobacterium BACA0444]